MRFQIAQALAHFLWEGAAIGVVLCILLQILRDARSRYNACATALALMCLAPVATLLWLAPRQALIHGARGTVLDTPLPASATNLSWFEANAAWMFWLWLAGALALLARAALSWWRARDLVTRDFEPLPASADFAARRLAAQLGVKAVQFRSSARVASALVFGWLKPIVVLPAAALGRLTEAEIEALLAHELAHVLRGDFFVNLLQTVAECVLFYHPLVWWVSARMREERELCCDDIAVAVCRDEVLYSRALLRLEELRMEPALAATGGRLAHRIRRLLTGYETEPLNVAPGLALLLLLGVSVALLAQDTPPQPPEPPAPPPDVATAPAPPLVPPAPPKRGTNSDTTYRSGDGVSMPRLIYKVEPGYTEQARAAHLEGTTVLAIVVTPQGTATDIEIVKSLDKGLDQKAIEAIRRWKFEPGLKDGKPVRVRANVEVNFRLWDKPPVPPTPAVAPVPRVAPSPLSAPTPRVAPVPAVAPEPLEPLDPPAPGEVLPAPPAPPAPPTVEVVRGVVGGVPGAVVTAAAADRSEMERRRRYASERFGGENTDRSKVYIRYGPPDEIDSQTSQGKRVDIWRYKDAAKEKVMLEIQFRDGRQVRRAGGLAADI